jgi:hypothetical protein
MFFVKLMLHIFNTTIAILYFVMPFQAHNKYLKK